MTFTDIRKEQDDLVLELKQKIKSIVDGSQYGIRNAKSVHKSKIKEYLKNTITAIIVGSFAVPAITTLIVMEGWEKLAFIAFCIPFISQIASLFFLGCMVFSNSGLTKEQEIIAWSIVIYLIGAICYFFIAKLSSKDEMGTKIEKERDVLQKASPYFAKIMNL